MRPAASRGQSMRSKARKRARDRVAGFIRRQPVDAFGHQRRDEVELFGRLGDRLAQPLAHVDEGRDAEREQKGDDEHRYGAAQKGLGGEEPPVGGSCDRLSQTLDGIGMRRRARAFGARHLRPPFGMSPSPLTRKGCAASLPNHFHSNRNRFVVESRANYLGKNFSIARIPQLN